MRYKLNFFLFFGLTFGNVEFFPSQGTVFVDKKSERVAFLEEKTPIEVSFSIPLPHLERPDRKFEKCPMLAKRGKDFHLLWSEHFFLSRLRRDLGIEVNAEKAIFLIKSKTRVERESSPARKDLDKVGLDAADERGHETSTINNISSSYVTTIDTPTNQTTNTPGKLLTSENGVSNLTAKHPKDDIRNLFQNENFQFECAPSSNGKVYRLISWATEKPIEKVSIKINGPFYNPENLKNAFFFNLNSKSTANNGDSVLKMCEYQTPQNATVSFLCQNSYAMHSKYSYNMNIVFENQHSCENSIFSNLTFKFVQTHNRRKRRQVGEFAIPLIMGFLGYELGHRDDSEDAKIEENVQKLQTSDFSNNEQLTKEIKAVEAQTLQLNKNYNSRFESIASKLCFLETLEVEEILVESLNTIFDDFMIELQFILLSSANNLPQNRILRNLKKLCRKANSDIFDNENFCDEFFRLEKFEIRTILVPTKYSENLNDHNIKLIVTANLPKFFQRKASVKSVFTVPVPMGLKGENFEYSLVQNLPSQFAHLDLSIGPYNYISLSFCQKSNNVHFCPINTLNLIFEPETVCINNFLTKDHKCEVRRFESIFDCYFLTINPKLLLLSNSGQAKIERIKNAPNHNFGVKLEKNEVLRKVELIHNITSDVAITCNKTSLILKQVDNKYEIELRTPKPETFTFLPTSHGHIFESKTTQKITNITILDLTTVELTFGSKTLTWLNSLGGLKYFIYSVSAIILIIIFSTIFLSIWGAFRTWILGFVTTGQNIFQQYRRSRRVSAVENIPLRSVRRQDTAAPEL